MLACLSYCKPIVLHKVHGGVYFHMLQHSAGHLSFYWWMGYMQGKISPQAASSRQLELATFPILGYSW